MKFIIIAAIVVGVVLASWLLIRAIYHATQRDKALADTGRKDITEQLVSLGAKPLPDGAKYLYLKNHPDRYGNPYDSIGIGFDGKTFAFKMNLDGWENKDTPAEKVMLSAAHSAFMEFQTYYKKWHRLKRIEEIAEGKTMLPLGEPGTWKED